MKKYLLTLILFTSAFIFTSCMGAYTDISGTWTKPGYKAKKYNKILVVGISDEIVKRNTVETAFVNELGKDKIKSSTSNELVDFSKLGMNEEGKIDSVQIEELKKKVNEAGYDGAIVISLLDIQEKTDYVPGQTYYNRGAGYNQGSTIEVSITIIILLTVLSQDQVTMLTRKVYTSKRDYIT